MRTRVLYEVHHRDGHEEDLERPHEEQERVVLRGALQAIPRGQSEAAEALGIPPLALWRRILVPQAIRIGLPSLVNELILLVKVSSLASVVGIAELTRVAQNITGETYRPLEIYVTAAAIYFVINFTLSRIGRLAERRLQIG